MKDQSQARPHCPRLKLGGSLDRPHASCIEGKTMPCRDESQSFPAERVYLNSLFLLCVVVMVLVPWMLRYPVQHHLYSWVKCVGLVLLTGWAVFVVILKAHGTGIMIDGVAMFLHIQISLPGMGRIIPPELGFDEDVFAVTAHAVSLSLVLAPILSKKRALRDRIPPGHCKQCGYNLTGNTSGICPECGTPTRELTNT